MNWEHWATQAGIEFIDQESQVAKLSQDYFHFSPILTPLLENKRGEVVLRPANVDQVLEIAQICVKQRQFVTVRGSGTGNYGQCVPLQGGVIVDMTRMQQIHWLKPGLACVDPGVRLATLDQKAREIGWETRMVPSTVRTATIGGFIAGGSGGIGSILYGQLRDRGNLRAVKVVTLTDPPTVLTLRGEDAQVVNHAYGVNGIITELEIPLAPAYPWEDCLVAFRDFVAAARFAAVLSKTDGIIKKLVSVHADPIPTYFAALRSLIPVGSAIVLALVSQSDREPFLELATTWGGNSIPLPKNSNLIEYSWNHTTLHARAADPQLTYLQCLFPSLDRVEMLHKALEGEVLMHLEFIRSEGEVVAAGIPLVRFTTADRIAAIIDFYEQQGVLVANPHTYILEDGGMKTINQAQLNFKRRVDPYGLMNPGKMRAWWEVSSVDQ